MAFNSKKKPTHKVVRLPGRWARIPRMSTYRGATVFSDGHYERGEYRIISPSLSIPDDATLCFTRYSTSFRDIDWYLEHRKTQDRTALQSISFCLTRHLHPVEYYRRDGLKPYQQGDDNVKGVPRVVWEAWHKLPAGLRQLADRPPIDYVDREDGTVKKVPMADPVPA